MRADLVYKKLHLTQKSSVMCKIFTKIDGFYNLFCL